MLAASVVCANETWQAFPVWPGTDEQEMPAICGDIVVWQDMYFGDYDILAADIWQRNKPADFGVSLVEHEQENPAISGDIVVWQSRRAGIDNWDIYAADVSTTLNAGVCDPNGPTEFPIAAGKASQTNPAIDGHLIVWQGNRAGNWDIFGYNLITGQRFRITDDASDQINPAISGNTIVFQDNRDGVWQIYIIVLDGPEVAHCLTDIPGDSG